MNKKLSFALVLILFFAQTLIAQENEPALAKVHYHFMHINDTTAKDQYHDEETVLYLGQHVSYYTSYSETKTEELLLKQAEDPAFDGNLTLTSTGSRSRESYYTIPHQQVLQLVYTVAGGETYRVDEAFPVLDWKIENESKEIGGYTCQKATVLFKGREYIAWFTTELPFQAGPWKLQGLPGLILEASDRKKEVVFTYAGFDKMLDAKLFEERLKGSTKADKKVLERKIKAFAANPEAYMKARSQGGGDGISRSPLSKIDPNKIKSINIQKGGVQKSKVTNNPIEII